MATKNTATKTEKTFEALREKATAFGTRASELGHKSFEQNWQLGLQVQEKMFAAMEQNLDQVRTQMDFVLDNQKAMIEMMKKQVLATEELVHEGLEESAAQVKSALEIH